MRQQSVQPKLERADYHVFRTCIKTCCQLQLLADVSMHMSVQAVQSYVVLLTLIQPTCGIYIAGATFSCTFQELCVLDVNCALYNLQVQLEGHAWPGSSRW